MTKTLAGRRNARTGWINPKDSAGLGGLGCARIMLMTPEREVRFTLTESCTVIYVIIRVKY